jgi:hypothetical protein
MWTEEDVVLHLSTAVENEATELRAYYIPYSKI